MVTQHHIRSTAPVTNGPACRITPTGSSQYATLALSWLSSKTYGPWVLLTGSTVWTRPSWLENVWTAAVTQLCWLEATKENDFNTTALVILPTLRCSSSRRLFSMIINLTAQRQFETLFSSATITMNNEHTPSSLWNTLAHWVPWCPTQCPFHPSQQIFEMFYQTPQSMSFSFLLICKHNWEHLLWTLTTN